MATTSTDSALQTLRSTLENLSILLTQLQSGLEPSPPSSTPSSTPASNPPTQPSSTSSPTSKPPSSPLLLLHTSTTLLRAQTTKLSLLSLNKPFTPSALTSTLSIYTRILPSLTTAIQGLAPPTYPAFLHSALARRARSTLAALGELLGEVPRTEEEQDDKGHGGGQDKGRQGREGKTLKGTGVVWEECDWVTGVCERGVGLLAAEKIRGWGELLGDAVEEVEEWVEGGEDGDGDEVDEEEEGDELQEKVESLSLGNGSSSDDEIGLFGEHPFREELQPAADEVVATLKLVRMLFPPLLKRRIGRFPKFDKETKPENSPAESILSRLDSLVTGCEMLSEESDEAVAALYSGDEKLVKERLNGLRQKAVQVATVAAQTWEGGDDELTEWIKDKWMAKLELTKS